MPHQEFTVPPPFAGLDLVSPINAMSPEYAIELVNVFPGATAPITRKGYAEYVDLTPTATSVNTLYPFNKSDGNNELIAVTNGATRKIYSILAGTALDVTGTTAISATGTNCQCEQFGSRLYICNGVDTVQVYNGSTTVDSTFTGVTLANLINVSSYKSRLYFVEKNTLKFWYGNTDAVGSSALNSFDLQYVMKKGGRLLFAGSYTNQAAQTSQDLFWAISSEGEIVFYSGSSPASDVWGLVARFVIGKPLGYRAFVRVNNDVWILTEQGIVPLSALFQADPEQAVNVISARINPFITEAAVVTPFSPRWHGSFWPQGRRVIINVPLSETETRLLVYSIDSKGWCVYDLTNRGDGITFAVAGPTPYYGSASGVVYEAETGYEDNGFPIQFCIRTAFSYCNTPEQYKAFKDIRPLLKTKKGLSFDLAIDTDFRDTATGDTVSTGTGTTTLWGATGAAPGGSGFTAWGSPWASGPEYIYNRYSVRGQGHSASIKMDGTQDSSQCSFFGFELRFDAGGQV